MRVILLALQLTGAGLFLIGACGLAYLAHPFLAVLVGGFLLLLGVDMLELHRSRKAKR